MSARPMASARRRGRTIVLLPAALLCLGALARGRTLLPATSTAPSHAGPHARPAAGLPDATRPFLDDFNGVPGARPDPAKWVDYGPKCGAYASWGKIRCGASEHLDGRGHLVIPATPSAGSALQTKGRHGFTYGTMAAWIKMPTEPGYWPSFWALNGEQTGSESLTGEIDATEVHTAGRGTHTNAHVWDGPRRVWRTRDLTSAAGIDLTKRFHKYSVRIEPGRMTFFFDDLRVRVVKRSSSTPWAWGPKITRPNFLILDLAIRRAPARAPSRSAAMLVDRVQVIPSESG
ncbi:MAG TPA: glycoside hydrolase family 16 protein [Baekduia sp.]|uniref:glycoside hydrolase family 16 protein n=1 Tax=Baekduia sp. TaxID=2600305 RepID=UPI002CD2134F|nr:glycoside hydrolase family 16 protein [Baekduia sp.]HMJ35923.1 glycoside hydrolase family 16 protein [Baekduia sp.]